MRRLRLSVRHSRFWLDAARCGRLEFYGALRCAVPTFAWHDRVETAGDPGWVGVRWVGRSSLSHMSGRLHAEGSENPRVNKSEPGAGWRLNGASAARLRSSENVLEGTSRHGRRGSRQDGGSGSSRLNSPKRKPDKNSSRCSGWRNGIMLGTTTGVMNLSRVMISRASSSRPIFA